MNDNKFTGPLDVTVFKSLRNIQTLRLNDNQFTGTIPDMFDYLNRVSDLQLQNNKLSGTVAHTIFQLVGLSKYYYTQSILFYFLFCFFLFLSKEPNTKKEPKLTPRLLSFFPPNQSRSHTHQKRSI